MVKQVYNIVPYFKPKMIGSIIFTLCFESETFI